MTAEISREVASREHALKQPLNERYALFCKIILRGEANINCDSQRKLGHLGDFVDDESAERMGLIHPHPVVIRFYPI